MDNQFAIPGGMLCTVCGLRYYSQSMGGPGICPSCDCGNVDPQVVRAQREEIARLRALLRCADASVDETAYSKVKK